MSFRIGITVGDVVERDGDLLGDGVNIAARLEGIAPVGGICISRTVHEQVANKLSVHFADIGEQQVKNIPTPVHAYKIEMRLDDAVAAAPAKTANRAPSRSWAMPAAIAAAGIAALGISGLAYLTLARPSGPQIAIGANPPPAAPAKPPTMAVAPSSTPIQPTVRPAEALVPETIPVVLDRARLAVRNDYMPAPGHKALAISFGPIGMSTGQADDETAKSAALDLCQARANALPVPRKCDLYALGNTVVYAHGHPPLPPAPWVTRDAAIERPIAVSDIPLMRDVAKANVEKSYLPGRNAKALAIAPSGGSYFYFNQSSTDEAARRALEVCGSNAGVACMIVAVNDNFVVPVPTTMKVTGFFHPAAANTIAPELRDDVARRLGNGGGWTAVAAGGDGKAGVMVKAANEQAAIDGALADCARQDRACRVIAIGPFAVEAK